MAAAIGSAYQRYMAVIADSESTIASAEKAYQSLQDAIDKATNPMSQLNAGVTTFANTVKNAQTAYAAYADLIAKNIDELVDVYQAQINVISSQNRMTQAISLNAVATQVFGQNSEEASRTTIAMSYNEALLTQARKNEQVAAFNYTTATAANVATMTQSMYNLMQVMITFGTVMQALSVSTEMSAQRAALAAIPLVGMVASLGLMAYQMVTSPVPAMPNIPSRQFGGGIPKTGMYMLHQGETVTPKGGPSGMAPNVNITINASSGMDLAKIRQEVQNAIGRVFYESSKSRGTY